jgi:DNA polymerase gamma 1
MLNDRFPHPVTLAGMLEMGSTLLPVNADWFRYINSAQTKHDALKKEQQAMLMKMAEDALSFAENQKFELSFFQIATIKYFVLQV